MNGYMRRESKVTLGFCGILACHWLTVEAHYKMLLQMDDLVRHCLFGFAMCLVADGIKMIKEIAFKATQQAQGLFHHRENQKTIEDHLGDTMPPCKDLRWIDDFDSMMSRLPHAKKPGDAKGLSIFEMFSFHLCEDSAMGTAVEDSCCQGGSFETPEVIFSEPMKTIFPQSESDPNSSHLAREVSPSDELAPVEDENSSPTSPAFAVKKMTESRHVESEYEIMRGISLHRALRHSELWTSPHEIRRRNLSAQVWDLSKPVSKFDTFLSHTWRTKGRWKVLALMMQTGWLHALFAWFVGVAVMLSLRAFDIVHDPWQNENSIIAPAEGFPVSYGPWTVISEEFPWP